MTSDATWTSSNSAIATATLAGLVTGVAPGDVIIAATYQSLTAARVVTIKAPPARVTGFVTDEGTGQPVVEAEILLMSPTTGGNAFSDRNGYYHYDEVDAPNFTLRVQHGEYETVSRSVMPADGLRLDFAMRRSANPCRYALRSPHAFQIPAASTKLTMSVALVSGAGCPWKFLSPVGWLLFESEGRFLDPKEFRGWGDDPEVIANVTENIGSVRRADVMLLFNSAQPPEVVHVTQQGAAR